MIISLFEKIGLNEFLGSIKVISFISFLLGMSLFYPANCQIFFIEILSLLNFDLASDIEWLNIDFTPR